MNKDNELDTFEYVLGTLRGRERRAFEQAQAKNVALSKAVQFWEGQFMEYDQITETVAPRADTWQAIETSLNQSLASKKSRFKISWAWLMPLTFSFCFALYLWLAPNNTLPNTGYIAVLTDDAGKPELTALTTENNLTMWLQWQGDAFTPGTSAQLWAISKRDGEARPITVFDQKGTLSFKLDEATWRLVTDAATLVLTEEEVGGSAIDEPSDIILAKGACIQFDKGKHAS